MKYWRNHILSFCFRSPHNLIHSVTIAVDSENAVSQFWVEHCLGLVVFVDSIDHINCQISSDNRSDSHCDRVQTQYPTIDWNETHQTADTRFRDEGRSFIFHMRCKYGGRLVMLGIIHAFDNNCCIIWYNIK